MSEKAVTVRLPWRVYMDAHDLSAITGVSIKRLVIDGLNAEIEARLKEHPEVRAVMEDMKRVRSA